MSPKEEVPDGPNVEDLARGMLFMYGPHDDDEPVDDDEGGPDTRYRRGPRFPIDSERYALIQAATERNTDRYLHLGLVPVECRRCGSTVEVKKLSPAYTAVQWNSAALDRCAHFAEERAAGRDSSRARSCPHLSQSIKHAVAEGLLEESSSAPAPGDCID